MLCGDAAACHIFDVSWQVTICLDKIINSRRRREHHALDVVEVDAANVMGVTVVVDGERQHLKAHLPQSVRNDVEGKAGTGDEHPSARLTAEVVDDAVAVVLFRLLNLYGTCFLQSLCGGGTDGNDAPIETALPVLYCITAGEKQVVITLGSGHCIVDWLDFNQRRMDIVGMRAYQTRVERPANGRSSLMTKPGHIPHQCDDGCRIIGAAQLSNSRLKRLLVRQRNVVYQEYGGRGRPSLRQ